MKEPSGAGGTNRKHSSSDILVSSDTFDHLRPAQWPVIESIVQYMSNRPPELVRGYVEAPTGSGKTVLFTRLLEEQRTQGELPPTVIVTYTNQLVEQTVDKLGEHGFSGSVAKVVGWKKDEGENDVLVTTYAGFAKQILNLRSRAIDGERIGQVIFDEAHHTQGEATRKAAGILGNAAFLGFTATADYDHRRLLSDFLPDEIHTINQVEGVHLGLVAPFRVVVLDTAADMSGVRVFGTEYEMRTLEKAINVQWRNTQIAKFYVEHFSGQRALFNASTVQHAMDMNLALLEQGVAVATVHGGMSTQARRDTIRAFQDGTITVITQAKLISEGYDDPALSLVFNISPTLSRVKAIQRARGGRIDPSNPHKVMIVVECLDDKYRASPQLYGSERVAGAWECYADEQQRRDIGRLILPLTSYDSVRVITEKSDIEAGYSEDGVPRRKARRMLIDVPVFEPKDPQCAFYPTEVFFLKRGKTAELAKQICAGCVDLEHCLDSAVRSNQKDGIWAGTSPRQRRALRKILRGQGEEAFETAKTDHLSVLKAEAYKSP